MRKNIVFLPLVLLFISAFTTPMTMGEENQGEIDGFPILPELHEIERENTKGLLIVKYLSPSPIVSYYGWSDKMLAELRERGWLLASVGTRDVRFYKIADLVNGGPEVVLRPEIMIVENKQEENWLVTFYYNPSLQFVRMKMTEVNKARWIIQETMGYPHYELVLPERSLIYRLTLTVEGTVTFEEMENLGIEIEPLTSAGLPPIPADFIYSCFKIELGPGGSISSIEFIVPKNIMEQIQLGNEEISLLKRVGDSWSRLETRRVMEDENHNYFSARVEGHSTFAIVGRFTPAWYEQPLNLVAIAGTIVVVIVALLLIRRRRALIQRRANLLSAPSNHG